MGPTNIALVKLYQADLKLREAQAKLDAATRNVRIQERRAAELSERATNAHAKLMSDQVRSANLDLDLKSRDAHIEKLRTQQQSAKTNKEYQTFLIEINTHKVDKGKVEEDAMSVMESVEREQRELAEMTTQLDGENTKLESMRNEIGDRINELQAEIDALKPARAAAADATPPKARAEFERLADRYDGEVMAAIERPHKRREEYACTACNMDLVTDIYNRLHTRDDIVYCPSCRRMLFIPEDLPVEAAVNKVKEKKPLPPKVPPAGANRQTSAIDVLNSMTPEPDEPGVETAAPPTASGSDASTPDASAPDASTPDASVPGDMTPPSTRDVPEQSNAQPSDSPAR